MEGRAGDRDVEALIAEFCERREGGEALDAERFAAEHPEGGDALLRGLRRLRETEALFPGSESSWPRHVGRYRVVGEVGSGGMGRILEVEHEARPEQRLALKLLHAGLEQSPRAIERFRRECDALAQVEHPGVVRVVDSGLSGAQPYLVMELVDGESLAARIQAARAGERPDDRHRSRRAAEIVAAVARAIAAVHARGVLHRDLSPRNVLVRSGGEPVVIDFGLVRQEDTPTLTASGDTLGTPQYMSPEQARGERVDERCDVYALGALLHELVTLRPPRSSTDTMAVLKEAGALPLRGPRSIDADVPRGIDTIVRRATSFRREWRYADAAALADDLEAWLAGRPIRARRPGPAERALDLWLRRRGLVLSGGVAALLVTTVVIARALAPSGEEESWRVAYEPAAVAWLDGDRDALRSAIDRLIELRPDEPVVAYFDSVARGLPPEDSGDAALGALIDGRRLLDTGRPEEAFAQFEVSWNLRPHMPHTLVLLGRAALESGDHERARTALEMVATPLSASARLHRMLCELYVAIESWPDAVKAGETAVRLAPEDAEVWLLLARARFAVDDESGGVEAVRSARSAGGSIERLDELARDFERAGEPARAAAVREALAEAPR